MPRNIIKSILPFAISLIMFFIVGKFGFSRISEVRGEISQVSKDRTALTEKLNTLKSLVSDAATGSQIASIALPEKNSSLATFSQIKLLATQNNLLISGIKSGGGASAKEGLASTSVIFEVAGPKQGIFSFLTSVGKIAPLTQVDKIRLNESAGSATATVTLKTFYASYPTKLPSITQPAPNLTAEDREMLIGLTQLILPQYSVIPVSEGGRPNPFTQ